MALFRPSSRDITGFKVFFALVVLYGLVSYLAYFVIQMKLITHLGFDAPLDRFSEARAIEHIRVLAEDIGGRQEGSPVLRQAAKYIKTQLEMIKERAGSDFRIEIEETIVNGSFNMIFFGQSLTLTYRNHTNILMRILLLLIHYISLVLKLIPSLLALPLVPFKHHYSNEQGSQSGWIPPRPVIFLFNGAEELFMLGSHGFMTTHRWRDTIVAFIDIEASGTGGFDLVCQSGPGSWPSYVYAQSTVYPMAKSAAQDIFGAIPGDTDYRMFVKDYGDIPGLDIIFLLGGYFYHTSSDIEERIIPGSMQARGDNLFSVMKAFTNSSKLLNAQERVSFTAAASRSEVERAVFFDHFSQFLVCQDLIFRSFIQEGWQWCFTVFQFLSSSSCLFYRAYQPTGGLICSFAAYYDFLNGLLYHASEIILAIIFPVTFAILRLLFCEHSMNWFANPHLAFFMFVPCSIVGLLVPRVLWRQFPLSQEFSAFSLPSEELVHEARFWGAFGFYSFITLVYLLSGLSGGFMTFFISVFMVPAWISSCLSVKCFGHKSLRSTACYVVPLIPCLMHSIYFGGFLAMFVIEKMGMTGSLPPSYGK